MINSELQRFIYGDDAWISYSIINGDTAVTGNFSVPQTFSCEQMTAMLVSFAAELAAACPEINYLTNYPGTKNVALARSLITLTENHLTRSEHYSDKERVPAEGYAAFREVVMGCENHAGTWVCRPQGSPIPRVAACAAIRPGIEMRPMLRYHPILEGGFLGEATLERPPEGCPCHITMSDLVSQMLVTHRARVGENGSLIYEEK